MTETLLQHHASFERPYAPSLGTMTGSSEPASALPSLRVLGSLEVLDPRARALSPLTRQPKRAGLLAFLLLDAPGEFRSRDRVVDHFWPDSEKKKARASLRQALRFIRRHLGDDVVESRGHHAIRVPPNALDCDALRFERLVDQGRGEEALRAYRGPLLDGYDTTGSLALDQWLDRRRNRYGGLAAEAAWQAADAAELSGDPVAAAFWGKRALSLTGFDEAAVRRLIALLDRVGDRTGALRAYRGLRHKLREFGSRPSPETEKLVARVRTRPAAAPSIDHPISRRRGVDRRRDDRRDDEGRWAGPERRTGDRRQGDRRSGRDRRGDLA